MDADPNLAAAHELWGYLLSAKGDFQSAVTELESALRLKPDSWRAHYELGLALGRLGNSAAALEHLKLAAQGTDPEVRSAALQMLQRLGRQAGPQREWTTRRRSAINLRTVVVRLTGFWVSHWFDQ